MLPRLRSQRSARAVVAGEAVTLARTIAAMTAAAVNPMNWRTAALLTVPPLLWAGNAVVGQIVVPLIPPMTLNFLRWAIAFLVLLPLGGQVFRPSSKLWSHWRRFALLGLLSVGAFNSLQYLALHTSSALNITLLGASMPFWMMSIGRMLFGVRVSRTQILGALLAVVGAIVVVSRGQLASLVNVHWVQGDLYMVLAILCWSLYSWLLARPTEPTEIRSDWAAFLLAQIGFGLVWSALFVVGEWVWAPTPIVWGWPLAIALIFVALGPAVIAYRCWSAGVTAAGPTVAGFFSNLTPLFAAVMSSAFLGAAPKAYHAVAFVLIMAGIALSSRKLT